MALAALALMVFGVIECPPRGYANNKIQLKKKTRCTLKIIFLHGDQENKFALNTSYFAAS